VSRPNLIDRSPGCQARNPAAPPGVESRPSRDAFASASTPLAEVGEEVGLPLGVDDRGEAGHPAASLVEGGPELVLADQDGLGDEVDADLTAAGLGAVADDAVLGEQARPVREVGPVERGSRSGSVLAIGGARRRG